LNLTLFVIMLQFHWFCSNKNDMHPKKEIFMWKCQWLSGLSMFSGSRLGTEVWMRGAKTAMETGEIKSHLTLMSVRVLATRGQYHAALGLNSEPTTRPVLVKGIVHPKMKTRVTIFWLPKTRTLGPENRYLNVILKDTLLISIHGLCLLCMDWKYITRHRYR